MQNISVNLDNFVAPSLELLICSQPQDILLALGVLLSLKHVQIWNNLSVFLLIPPLQLYCCTVCIILPRSG